MSVIRKTDAEALLSKAAVLDLSDLARQADAILARAQRQAGEILEQAQARHDKLVAEGHAKGYAEGLAKGHAEGLAKGRDEGVKGAIKETRERAVRLEQGWAEALVRFEKDRSAMLSQARQDVLSLALEIARRITRRSLSLDPSIIGTLIEEALSHVAAPTQVEVSVRADEERLAAEMLPAIAATFKACRQVGLRPDPSLPPGSVIVRGAGGGEVDASVETQLARITDALAVADPAGGTP